MIELEDEKEGGRERERERESERERVRERVRERELTTGFLLHSSTFSLEAFQLYCASSEKSEVLKK